jgi:S1-C subfamily serine protease
VTGAYVTRVDGGSPAAAAGLLSGDVIVEFAGQLITDADDLVGATRAQSIGDVVTIRYVRAGRSVATKATLVRSPQD